MFLKKIVVAFLLICLVQVVYADQGIKINSPDGNIQLSLIHRTDGSMFYSIIYKGKTVIMQSGLGMKFSKPGVSLVNFDLLRIDSSKKFSKDFLIPLLTFLISKSRR